MKYKTSWIFGSFHIETAASGLFEPSKSEAFINSDVVMIEHEVILEPILPLIERIKPYKDFLNKIWSGSIDELVTNIRFKYDLAYRTIGNTWLPKYLRDAIHPSADLVSINFIRDMLFYFDAFQKTGFKLDEQLSNFDFHQRDEAIKMGKSVKGLGKRELLDLPNKSNKRYLRHIIIYLTGGITPSNCKEQINQQFFKKTTKNISSKKGTLSETLDFREYCERESYYTLWQQSLGCAGDDETNQINVRNKDWVESFVKESESHAVFAIAGGAHMHGENGMLRLLIKKGFKVEPKDCPRSCDPHEIQFDKVMDELLTKSKTKALRFREGYKSNQNSQFEKRYGIDNNDWEQPQEVKDVELRERRHSKSKPCKIM